MLDQFGTTRGAQYKLATELGLALLHYYNKIGIDIICLEWDQFFEDEALRILNGNDLQTIFGVPISSLDEFVTSLRDAVWQDMFLKQLVETFREAFCGGQKGAAKCLGLALIAR